ncbi:uncharacterized protein [Aegilops tauschii subsp. strangulata]|uniref:uncharacterized protein n=1 Tax=Aegilops tauschii subsp. strangulata TaxID=200361 RepID=UPI000989E5AB|nr:uncharacterized protein LOC109751009 [Aegilops tauschii subsp. strangulata]
MPHPQGVPHPLYSVVLLYLLADSVAATLLAHRRRYCRVARSPSRERGSGQFVVVCAAFSPSNRAHRPLRTCAFCTYPQDSVQRGAMSSLSLLKKFVWDKLVTNNLSTLEKLAEERAIVVATMLRVEGGAHRSWPAY